MAIMTMKEGMSLIAKDVTDKIVNRLGLEVIEGETHEDTYERVMKAIDDKRVKQ